MAIVLLRIRALMFRQDYRINRMIVWKIKNHVDPVILSENILALCLNNYELISNKGKKKEFYWGARSIWNSVILPADMQRGLTTNPSTDQGVAGHFKLYTAKRRAVTSTKTSLAMRSQRGERAPFSRKTKTDCSPFLNHFLFQVLANGPVV